MLDIGGYFGFVPDEASAAREWGWLLVVHVISKHFLERGEHTG